MKRIMVVISCLLFALAGCSSKSADYVYLVSAQIETMDPVDASYSQTFQLFADIFSGMMQIDGNGNLINDNASEITVSDDNLTYTIKMRDDLNWVNNEGEVMAPVTAHDYEYAFKRMVDPQSASIYAYVYEVIDNATEITDGSAQVDSLGVKALDDYTLEINLEYVAPYFTSMLAFGSFMPVSEQAVEQYGEDYGTSASTTWYNGAYYVTEYEPEYVVHLEKNEDYYGADDISINSIDARLNEDSSSRYNAVVSGEADFAELTTSEDYVQGLEEGNVHDQLTAYSHYAVLNTANDSVTSNPTLRKALAYGFDRETIAKTAFGEINQPIEYIIPSGVTPSSYDGVEYRDYSEDSLITFDKEKADKYFDQYMKEMGYTDRSQITIEFLAGADSSGNSKLAEGVQSSYLQNFGITVDTTIQPFDQYLESRNNGAFDMYVQSWGPDYADPATYLGLWQSNQIGSQNRASYNNPEYDKLYEKAVIESDVDSRFTDFAKLEKMIVDDNVAIPLLQLNSPYMLSEGFEMTAPSVMQVSHQYISMD